MWKQRHFILNIQKLEAGRLSSGPTWDTQQKLFWGEKKTRKIFKFYFYVYKCVREESDLL